MTRSNHSRRRDVRAHMAEHGVSYTEALRALTSAPPVDQASVEASTSRLKPRPYERGGPRLPAMVTAEHDVNVACGHYLGNRCVGCSTCTSCDGCYCEEMRVEAQQDAYRDRVERDHQEHFDQPGEDCDLCEFDRRRTKDFTECWKCGKELLAFWHLSEHNPPSCLPDKLHPRGLDWSHLTGRRITIDDHWRYHGDRARYAASWTGTVNGRHRNPRTGAETGLYILELDPTVPQPRTDIGSTPFDPRDFTITYHD